MELGESKNGQSPLPKLKMGEKQQNHFMPFVPTSESDADGQTKMENQMFDLNMKPNRIHEQASNNHHQVSEQFLF